MSFNQSEFEGFISSLGLRYLNPTEFLVGRYRSQNGPPPIHMWQNIVATAHVVDEIRAEFGSPVKLVSVYRTPEYNDPSKNSGRVRLSQHQAFTAIDFKVKGVSPSTVAMRLKDWMCSRWFFCPVTFQRKPVKISHGPIPFGALPQKMDFFGTGTSFTFKGYVNAYKHFTHVDTRGITSVKP